VPLAICHVRSSLNFCGGVAAMRGFALGFVINQLPLRSAVSHLSGVETTPKAFKGRRYHTQTTGAAGREKGPPRCRGRPHFLDGHRLPSLYRARILSLKFPCSNILRRAREVPNLSHSRGQALQRPAKVSMFCNDCLDVNRSLRHPVPRHG
jgi:hypothetical protein